MHNRLKGILAAVFATVIPVVVASAQQPDTSAFRRQLAAELGGLPDTTSAAIILPDSLVRKPVSFVQLVSAGDSLSKIYDFPAAVDAYLAAMEVSKDSSEAFGVQESLLLAQNGESMMAYCSHPVVVAHHKVPLKDFFLYYPLKDRSWRSTPNALDHSQGSDMAGAIFFPDSTKSVYYSAPDEEGIRNIYHTALKDSIWTLPRLLNEHITSNSDEIYPMLSQDGKTLYFASKGLYGMGGYDLYMSKWNKETGDWDVPINMGFPYSSPYDDFLYCNTADGRYTIFASNRDCAPGEVCLYVLEYDAMPLRRSVRDIDRLRELASLNPKTGSKGLDSSAAIGKTSQEAGTERYVVKMQEVNSLKDSITAFNRSINELRASLSSAPADKQAELVATIQEKELALPQMQKKLDAATREVQDIEMDFLLRGVALDPGQVNTNSNKDVVVASTGFTFVKNTMGDPVRFDMEQPAKEFDYSFKILPEGQFAESSILPDGIVYQIQFATGSRMRVRDLKGLSPVFEKIWPSLKCTYSVGVFRTYAEVLSHLNSVKNLGFRDAYITAYKDGESISVSAARAMEKK